ncbi:uncharacterized protein LOC125042457 [Penaeus chinensis]|uniref:uncharacterized protein LOC125042457 n=1 Tax=Penaeus chinensis TaxID=139456 RepID=UPI001FB6D35F|nr:uncharacterized protein LOC125042457 [Penaeus chinensis]
MWHTWLLLPFLFNVIACLDLRSMALGNGTVVWDQNSASFLCYPSATSSQLPADHQDFTNSSGGTLVFQPAETDARHAARVICRQLGYSHLERVYRVAFKFLTKTKRNLASAAASPPPFPPSLPTNRASGGPGTTTKTGTPAILRWRAECQGYEPILTHCPNMEVLDDAGANDTCDHLLGVQCGMCSKN